MLWRLYKARFEATLSQRATRPSGGYEMMCHRKTGREQPNPYTTVEDFCRLFAKGMSELYQLSFLLTADHQKAEQCFVAGLKIA